MTRFPDDPGVDASDCDELDFTPAGARLVLLCIIIFLVVLFGGIGAGLIWVLHS